MSYICLFEMCLCDIFNSILFADMHAVCVWYAGGHFQAVCMFSHSFPQEFKFDLIISVSLLVENI